MIDSKTTLNQLANSINGGQRLIIMIGAKNIVYSNKESFVAFKFMRGATNKANHIKITLNAMDTYDVEFSYIRGINIKSISKHEGIYDDMLHGLFINETGLRLSL